MTTSTTPRLPAILRPAQIDPIDRGAGVKTTRLVTPAIGATSFINGITTFAPGMVVPFHSHNCEESVTLLEGSAVLDIDGEEFQVGPLDSTWIPPNVPHRFRNLSATEPFSILWTYARVDATRTLTENGVTSLILD